MGKYKREKHSIVKEVEGVDDDALFNYEYIISGEIMSRRDISLLEKMVFCALDVYRSTDWCDGGGNPLPLKGTWDEILGIFGIPFDEAAIDAMYELINKGYWIKVPNPENPGRCEIRITCRPQPADKGQQLS